MGKRRKRSSSRKGKQPPGMNALHEVAAQTGFSVEAVMLVTHCVSNACARAPGKGSPAHLSAKEICDSLLATARTSYKDRAQEVLKSWDLETSENVGSIVMALGQAGVLQVGPNDRVEDFDGLYGEDDLARLLSASNGSATSSESHRSNLVPRLAADHFAPHDLQDVTITKRAWPYRMRADLQRAIDQILCGGIVKRFSGVKKEYSHHGLELHDLMSFSRHENATCVPPIYEEIDIGEESPARCLQNGLWFAHLGQETNVPVCVLMAAKEDFHRLGGIKIEVAAPRVTHAQEVLDDFLRKLETAIQAARSYRGKVLSLEQPDQYHGRSQGILVHRLRQVSRDQIILPPQTLRLLERNVITFVQKRPALSRMGMQCKKGLLFYGAPGTGKTHTIHYLAGASPGHTTLLITADQIGLLDEYMSLARLLSPSIVVIEDADLVGRNRSHRHGLCDESLLNKLLNEMDGLREDTEVLFVLTTNRPEMLEPALAARPGRIDQSIEFPLPDEDGRRKLIHMYAFKAEVDSTTVDSIVRKTEGVSAAFIKELMRRAAQCRLETTSDNHISLDDVDAALEEMLFAGGVLNRKLLGAGAQCDH